MEIEGVGNDVLITGLTLTLATLGFVYYILNNQNQRTSRENEIVNSEASNTEENVQDNEENIGENVEREEENTARSFPLDFSFYSDDIPEAEKLTLRLKIKEETKEIIVSKADTVYTIKRRIFHEFLDNSQRVHFIHSGRLLEDNKEFSDYPNLRNQSVLHVSISSVGSTNEPRQIPPNSDLENMLSSPIFASCLFGACLFGAWILVLFYPQLFSTISLMFLASFSDKKMDYLQNIYDGFVSTPGKISQFHYTVILCSFIACQIICRMTGFISKNFPAYSKLSVVEQYEWQTRAASFAHALVAFPGAMYVLITDVPLWSNAVHGTNGFSDILFCIGAGYFASDFVFVVSKQIPPIAPIVAHHVIAGWGFASLVLANRYCSWFATYLLCTEATNIFNNWFWWEEKFGMTFKNSLQHKVTGFFFWGTWTVFRILNNGPLFYQLFNFRTQLLDLGPIPYFYILIVSNILFLVGLNIVFYIIGPFYNIFFLIDEKEKKK